METLLDDIDRNLIAEKRWILAVRQTTPAQSLKAARHELLLNIRKATASGDLALIIAVEQSILKNDLAHHANSKAMVANLRTAIDELQAVERHLALVTDTSAYRIVDQAHSLPKKRHNGLPFDDARQALASHHARLSNLDKSRLDEDEKLVLESRKTALADAQQRYAAQQAQTLGANS